jgi:phosphonate transport system substrate-binding protein
MLGWVPQVQACGHRGELAENFCDENHDLVADLPGDPKLLKDPSDLVFSYSPIEEPMMFAKVWRPFADYLGQCVGKTIHFRAIQTNTTEIEAMRSGKLHIAAFSTGTTGFAVNLAGAVPFAAKGGADGIQGYSLVVVVRKDHPYHKLADLKGKTIAHTSATSNSGNLAPRALFPSQGLTPDVDYRVAYSGKHDQSVLGVMSGDYDAAALSSSVFDRMVKRGQVKAENFRIIYRSQAFPTSAFVHAHDLAPDLTKRIRECFFEFKFSDELKTVFDGATRFVPVVYQRDWATVREVAKNSGTAYDAANYDRLTAIAASSTGKKKTEE